MKLRFAGYQGEASVHTRAGRLFVDSLGAALGDGADVSAMADITTTGRASVDLFDMVAGDDVQFCYFAASYLAERVPSLGVLDLPFSVHDRAAALAALDGEVGRRLIADVEAATPYKVLGFWDNGFRHFTNARRPLRQPADCRGLRLRTLNNQLYRDVLAAIGFEPVVTDAKDLLRVIETGAVDGQENPLTNLLNFGLWEFQPHVTLSAHFFGVALFFCNRAAFESWPAAVRQAVLAAARAATLADRRFAADDDVTCRAALEQKGIAFVTLTADERRAFQDAVADLVRPRRAALDPAVLIPYLASQEA